MSTQRATPWIHTYFSGIGEPEKRIFCFHYTGGAAQIFHPWKDFLGPSIEICAIQLPGRWERISEKPLENLDSILEALFCEIESRLNVPYAFFGYSFGGLIAFELCRTLRRNGARMPFHLMTASRWAPHLASPHPHIFALPDDEFLDCLVQMYGGLSPAVLAEPDLVKMLLPVMKADMKVWETFEFKEEAPLNVPISVSGGISDKSLPIESLQAWDTHTVSTFEVVTFDGGHFFFNANVKRFVEEFIWPKM